MALEFTRLVRSNYDELDNIPVIHQDLTASFTKQSNTYYIHTGSTTSAYTRGRMYYCDGTNLKKMVVADELPAVNDGKLTITVDGTAYTFSANQAGNTSFSITNTDTGATSVEVTGTGNAVTAASYDSSTRKLTLTKGTSFQEKLTAGSNITISGNTISAKDTTYTFTADNPTLAWSTKSKIGTIGGVEFNVTMPSNPNTDTGATSVEVPSAGNALTGASYNNSTRTIIFTKGTFLTSHQTIKTLNTNNTEAQTASASEAIAGSGTINLHKVAKTGNYNDLLNKPTIPTSIDGLTGGTVNGNITLKKELVFTDTTNPFIKMVTGGNTYYFQSSGGQFALGPTWDLATKWSADGSVQFPANNKFMGEMAGIGHPYQVFQNEAGYTAYLSDPTNTKYTSQTYVAFISNTDANNRTTIKDGVIINKKSGTAYNLAFPQKDGTLAVTSDIVDTGATSVSMSGSGNAVTTASYSPSSRTLILTRGTTFVTTGSTVQTISGKKTFTAGLKVKNWDISEDSSGNLVFS